ncbi:hypothetical protein BKA93DRAFT_826566 [Sparassis latifolia]
MAPSYRVFIGAPSPKDLRNPAVSYHWQIVSSKPVTFTLPPATLEAASRRISLLYQNIIFRESEDDEEEGDEEGFENALKKPVRDKGPQYDQDETTAITWPPSAQDYTESQLASRAAVTFLRSSAGISRMRSQLETQGTQETASYNYSDASSIGRFPTFHFSLHALTPLAALVAGARGPGKGSRKVSVLVAVLEVEGPDSIRIKRGVDAGKQVSLLKLILGDEDGTVCKLAAWREVAESWGGADPDFSSPGVKRGDVVLFENVLAVWDVEPGKAADTVPVSFTASPHLKSKFEICYRTMPSMPQDNRFRPDLRLGFSDAAVRKVAAVVNWFEGMAGLSTT